MNRYLVIVMVFLSLGAGCTWVHLDPGAEQVRVVSDSEVSECVNLGQVTVSLLDQIVGIKRNRKKVAAELVVLGRNSAAEMGGDTIVAISEIKDGGQSFNVYRCEKQ